MGILDLTGPPAYSQPLNRGNRKQNRYSTNLEILEAEVSIAYGEYRDKRCECSIFPIYIQRLSLMNRVGL